MKGHGLVGSLLVYSGDNKALTITKYDPKEDRYLLEQAVSLEKMWYYREAIEEGLLTKAVWLICPVWFYSGTVDTWRGKLANPLSNEAWSLSC